MFSLGEELALAALAAAAPFVGDESLFTRQTCVFILTLQAAFATTRALLQISIKEHIQFAAITVTTLLIIRCQARSALSFFRAGGAFIRAALALLTI